MVLFLCSNAGSLRRVLFLSSVDRGIAATTRLQVRRKLCRQISCIRYTTDSRSSRESPKRVRGLCRVRESCSWFTSLSPELLRRLLFRFKRAMPTRERDARSRRDWKQSLLMQVADFFLRDRDVVSAIQVHDHSALSRERIDHAKHLTYVRHHHISNPGGVISWSSPTAFPLTERIVP